MWTGALSQFVFFLTRHKFDIFVWGKCKVGFFVMYFCLNYSSALLVIISVEKFIALYFPLKTKTICTVRIAKRVSLVVALIFVLFDAQFIYIGETLANPGGLYCDYTNVSGEYLTILFGIVIAILYSYGPFLIMIIANFGIIYKFISAKLKTSQDGTESTSQALSKSAMKGTAMLLTVSFSFIILTAPIALVNVIYKGNQIPDTVFAITGGIEYVNHGINCVLYCISGTRFRNELKKRIGCHKDNLQRAMTTSAGNITMVSEVDSTSSPN